MFLTAQSRGDYSSSSQTPYTKSRSSRETDGYNNYRICKDRHNQQQFRISTYPTPNSTKSWRQRKFYPSHPASDASQQNNDLRSNRSSFLPEGEQNNADNRYELLLKKYQRVKQQLATYENEGTTTPVPQQHSQVAQIKNRDGSTGFTTLIECTREGSVGQGASDISSADDTCLSNWTGSDHRNENESVPNIAVGASTNLSTKAAVACAETVVDNSASVFEMKVESGESSAEGVVDLDEIKTITGVATSLLIVKDSPSEIDITNQFFKQPAPDPATTVETPEAEEEEDLDELELRRIALESAARRMAFDDDSDVAAASSPSTYTIQAEDAMACQSEKKDEIYPPAFLVNQLYKQDH
ncbi:hypothetical protein C0Q70_10642 [Pomacea canaliculata]|uniref:Uncharacterized protein n=1 Tax=Pomacea canaliculata TaxID=400727 RepID=A0A2T7P3S6_POMCA|nr:hypothetical protein C0Q70_10642 [Pomacea canaliculata]